MLEPCPRRLAVPRLLSLLSAHWRQHSSAPPPQEFRLYGAHSCKATVLAWARQMSLDRTLRRIQDDIRPMLDLQAQVVNHICAGFRPLQPLARGTSVPLPDFPVQVPSAPLPAMGPSPDQPLLASPTFPPEPSPLPPASPASVPSAAPLDDASSAESVSEASVDSSHASSSDDEAIPQVHPPRPPSPLLEAAGAHDVVRPPARALLDSSADLFIFNHRTNTVHAARPTDSGDMLAIPDPQDGDSFFRTACGSRAAAAQCQTLCRTLPPAASACLHRACRAAGLHHSA